MSEEEIRCMLNLLEISIEKCVEFGPVEVIKVKLEFDGEVISESQCDVSDLANE